MISRAWLRGAMSVPFDTTLILPCQLVFEVSPEVSPVPSSLTIMQG
jgi:hypothetical protein